MKIGAIVQARMSSQRFPNKVLYRVAGKPMLQYLLERLEHLNCLDTIVVATSVEESDTPIAEHCRENDIPCYRGPLDDVASRFNQVLNVYPFDGFVRVSGDSPLLDQRVVEKGVGIFISGNFDLVTNVMPPTYPKGQSVEVLRTSTYQRTYHLMKEADDLEHVTRFFYKNQKDFLIQNFALPENLNDIRLVVDTRQDMDTCTTIVSNMHKPHWEYTLEE